MTQPKPACAGLPIEWWFPFKDERHGRWSNPRITDETKENIHNGKRICYRCPIRDDCLDDALASGEQFGIWGGMTPPERRQEAQRRRRLGIGLRVAS